MGYPAYCPCAATAKCKRLGVHQEAKCLLNVDKVRDGGRIICGPAATMSVLSAGWRLRALPGYRGEVQPVDQDILTGVRVAGDKYHHQRFVIDSDFGP